MRACSLNYPAYNAYASYCVRFLVPTNFSALSHKRHHFLKKKKLLNIKCMFEFSLQILFEILLILRKIQRDTVINVKTSSCKVPVTFVRF